MYIKSLLIVDQSSMYLLKGTHHILEKQGENVQSARIIRFTSVDRIVELSSIIKEYIIEAIAIEESGVKVEFKKILSLYHQNWKINLMNYLHLEMHFMPLLPVKGEDMSFTFRSPKDQKQDSAG